MKNAQVLPKDFRGREAPSAVMRGFTRSLGVRCTHCHVGEEGKPLGTATTSFPTRTRTRIAPVRCTAWTRRHQRTPEEDHPDAPIRGSTCGAGPAIGGVPVRRPSARRWRKRGRSPGSEAAVARYRELRGRYEDAGAFDFRERTLADFAGDLVEEKDYEAAIPVLKLNAEVFPKSSDAWEGLGEAYRSAGKSELAVLSYRKALDLDAQNDGARQALRELEAPKAP